MTPSCCSAHI